MTRRIDRLNKLIFILVIGLLFLYIIHKCNIISKIFNPYDSCYTEQEYIGNAIMGMCSGYVGGTQATGYLSEQCVSCPYLVLSE